MFALGDMRGKEGKQNGNHGEGPPAPTAPYGRERHQVNTNEDSRKSVPRWKQPEDSN